MKSISLMNVLLTSAAITETAQNMEIVVAILVGKVQTAALRIVPRLAIAMVKDYVLMGLHVNVALDMLEANVHFIHVNNLGIAVDMETALDRILVLVMKDGTIGIVLKPIAVQK